MFTLITHHCHINIACMELHINLLVDHCLWGGMKVCPDFWSHVWSQAVLFNCKSHSVSSTKILFEYTLVPQNRISYNITVYYSVFKCVLIYIRSKVHPFYTLNDAIKLCGYYTSSKINMIDWYSLSVLLIQQPHQYDKKLICQILLT